MTSLSDISSMLAVDVQSVDKLRLQAKQNPDKALKEVAQQFEVLFMNMMLKSMREATPKDGMFDSEQTKFYTSMLDMQYAQSLSAKGIGLADMMVKQLTRSVVTPEELQSLQDMDASMSTLDSSSAPPSSSGASGPL